jgi:phosphoheptose isomerase
MSLLKTAIATAIETFQSLNELEEPLDRASKIVRQCLLDGHKLLTCGNGGSASDAAHFATEFLCRFMGDRRPYPAVSLTGEGGLLTAIGNDYAFEEIFARQIWGLGQTGDVVIAFTTSGRSLNVIRALEEASRKGLQSIAFLGKEGGPTRGLATVELIVKGDVTARIQEAQKLLFHVLCETVEQSLPKI